MRDPHQELAEIKAMMERSSRFLSLSGLSGVLAGIYALIGSGLTYYWIYFPNSRWGAGVEPLDIGIIFQRLLILAFVVLVLAVGTAGLLSQKRSAKTANQFWNPASKRFMKALFIPVVSGGLFAFSLIHKGQFDLIAAATLVFYGLGLINASHFALNDIKNLGFGQLILGLIAAFFPAVGLICWALGFGVLHVAYGTMMYYKYER